MTHNWKLSKMEKLKFIFIKTNLWKSNSIDTASLLTTMPWKTRLLPTSFAHQNQTKRNLYRRVFKGDLHGGDVVQSFATTAFNKLRRGWLRWFFSRCCTIKFSSSSAKKFLGNPISGTLRKQSMNKTKICLNRKYFKNQEISEKCLE